MFGRHVTVLSSLNEYSRVAPKSPLLYFSPHCGHCRDFADTYGSWAKLITQAAPQIKVYALDLSAIHPSESAIYNRTHPESARLPQFVPVMSLSGTQKVPRVLWGDKDGAKTTNGLTAFLLNNRKLDDNLILALSANLTNVPDVDEDALEGGATHHNNKTRATMAHSPKRSSRAHKSPQKFEVVHRRYKRSPLKVEMAHSLKRLNSPLKQWNALVLKETGSRQVLRRDHPMYARVKMLYEQMRNK